MSQNTVFCPACGEKVTLSTEYETKFCPYCGGPLPTLPDSSQVIHSDPVPDVETSTASTHSEPEPTVSHEPVAMNSEPFHPSAHSSQSGTPYNNTAAESTPPKDRGKLIVRWYLKPSAEIENCLDFIIRHFHLPSQAQTWRLLNSNHRYTKMTWASYN